MLGKDRVALLQALEKTLTALERKPELVGLVSRLVPHTVVGGDNGGGLAGAAAIFGGALDRGREASEKSHELETFQAWTFPRDREPGSSEVNGRARPQPSFVSTSSGASPSSVTGVSSFAAAATSGSTGAIFAGPLETTTIAGRNTRSEII